ncbi:MAG: hypothetical protein R2743_22555 [Ilumatobacteraceae bacterium]
MISILRTSYGIEVAFVPVFLNYTSHVEAFAPISYGMSVWGGRNPKASTGDALWARRARPRQDLDAADLAAGLAAA